MSMYNMISSKSYSVIPPYHHKKEGLETATIINFTLKEVALQWNAL